MKQQERWFVVNQLLELTEKEVKHLKLTTDRIKALQNHGQCLQKITFCHPRECGDPWAVVSVIILGTPIKGLGDDVFVYLMDDRFVISSG